MAYNFYKLKAKESFNFFLTILIAKVLITLIKYLKIIILNTKLILIKTQFLFYVNYLIINSYF